MSDRSCAEILALLLKHGSWYPSAIELDNYVRDEKGERLVDGQELHAEAIRAINREGACLGPCHAEHGPPVGLKAPE